MKINSWDYYVDVNDISRPLFFFQPDMAFIQEMEYNQKQYFNANPVLISITGTNFYNNKRARVYIEKTNVGLPCQQSFSNSPYICCAKITNMKWIEMDNDGEFYFETESYNKTYSDENSAYNNNSKGMHTYDNLNMQGSFTNDLSTGKKEINSVNDLDKEDFMEDYVRRTKEKFRGLNYGNESGNNGNGDGNGDRNGDRNGVRNGNDDVDTTMITRLRQKRKRSRLIHNGWKNKVAMVCLGAESYSVFLITFFLLLMILIASEIKQN
jgi:hypothetical protein